MPLSDCVNPDPASQNQHAKINEPFLRDLRVLVTDDLGNAVANVPVTFTPTNPNGATAIPNSSTTTVFTNAQGARTALPGEFVISVRARYHGSTHIGNVDLNDIRFDFTLL